MNSKWAVFVAASLGAAASAISLEASAATIQYTVTISGSGDYSDNAVLTPFSNLTVHIVADGDTTTLLDNPGVSRVVHLTSAAVTYSGATHATTVQHGSVLFVQEGTDAGVAGDGEFSNGMYGGAFTPYNVIYSVALAGYDAISSIGPVSFAPLDTDLGDPWEYEADTGIANEYIDFYSVTSATFSASVPEPASWAMMLMGFGGISAALRSCRRVTTAQS